MSSGKAADTRATILDAARALFEVDGYHAVGLEAVAARAGVSRQAIYLHFDSKPALLQALHQRINERDVAPVMGKVWTCPDAASALSAFVASSATGATSIVAIFTALDAARRVDPDVEASWQPGKKGRYADCMRLATWLDNEGLLAPGTSRREAADVIWSLTGIPSYQSLVSDRNWSTRRWVAWVTDTLRRSLLA